MEKRIAPGCLCCTGGSSQALRAKQNTHPNQIWDDVKMMSGVVFLLSLFLVLQGWLMGDEPTNMFSKTDQTSETAWFSPHKQ